MATSEGMKDLSRPTLHRWMLVFGLIAIATVACWPSTSTLLALWADTDNPSLTHGWLVAILSAWLVFRARHRIAAAESAPSKLGFAALLACSLAWVVFYKAGIRDLHLLLFPALIWLSVLAAFGLTVARTLVFPVGFLCLALPIWGSISGLLQDITTHAVGVMAWVTGLPAYIQGNRVTIPSGVFEIAGGCSGQHFFVAGLAIGALRGELQRDTLMRRAVLIAIIAALALVSNWVRVFTVIVAGHLTDMQHYLVRVDHYWFGWALFAAALVLYMWIANRLPLSPEADDETDSRPATTSFAPVAYAMAAVLMIAGPVLGFASSRAASSEGEGIGGVLLPVGKGAWSGPGPLLDSPWKPVFVGATRQDLAAYRDSSNRTVEVLSVIYRVQRQGAELVSWKNSLLGEGGLESHGGSNQTLPSGSFHETVATDRTDQRSIVWSSYEVGGRTFVRPLFSQVWYGVRSILGEPASGLVALRAECAPTCESARDTLTKFVEDMGTDLRVTARP
jgi:EpsI family protein